MNTINPRLYSSPWDRVQQQDDIAPGIAQVSTAGHGGIWLSADRNAVVPKYLREAAYAGLAMRADSHGWYEEDCSWAIPAIVFEAEFRAWADGQDRTAWSDGDTTMFHARQTMAQWYPAVWKLWLAEHPEAKAPVAPAETNRPGAAVD